MATSQVSVIRQAIKGVFTAQSVKFTAYDPGDNPGNADEYGWIGDFPVSQDHLTFGGSRDEVWEVPITIKVIKPGAGDVVAKAAEDRALVIAAYLESAARTDDTLGAVVFHYQVTEIDPTNGVGDQERWCQIDMTVKVEVHI